jgi:hypothetical protein
MAGFACTEVASNGLMTPAVDNKAAFFKKSRLCIVEFLYFSYIKKLPPSRATAVATAPSSCRNQANKCLPTLGLLFQTTPNGCALQYTAR